MRLQFIERHRRADRDAVIQNVEVRTLKIDDALASLDLKLADLAGICVLLVDDDADALQMARDALVYAGATVFTASNAGDALANLATQPRNLSKLPLGSFGLRPLLDRENRRGEAEVGFFRRAPTDRRWGSVGPSLVIHRDLIVRVGPRRARKRSVSRPRLAWGRWARCGRTSLPARGIWGVLGAGIRPHGR